MTSRFTLGSTLCFTMIKLTNSPFVIISQSSAALVPHILAACDPCRGCPDNLLRIVLHKRVTEATDNLKHQGTEAKISQDPHQP